MARDTFYLPEIPTEGTPAAAQLQEISKLSTGTTLWIPLDPKKSQSSALSSADSEKTVYSFPNVSFNMIGCHLKKGPLNTIATVDGDVTSACGCWILCQITTTPWGSKYQELVQYKKLNRHTNVSTLDPNNKVSMILSVNDCDSGSSSVIL
jgi:hypothetical protein